MDIQAVAEMYGGLPERVVARAREVLRLARAKSSIHEDMKTPVACLVVACRALDEPIDVKKMAALLHFSPRALDQIARKIANLVNAKSTQKVTPASLCVRHGCAAITEFVNRVYDAYQIVAQQLARGKPRGGGGGGGGVRLFDPNDPVFAAACLFACAKRAKLRVDRPKLIADTNANPRTFEAIVSSIEKQCHETLAGSIGSSGSRAKGGSSAGSGARQTTASADRVRVKPTTGMTKAAQRAAVVLERAVVENVIRQKDLQAMEQAKAAAQKQSSATSVTPEEYEAWRTKVLALRRQMVADGHATLATETTALAPEPQ